MFNVKDLNIKKDILPLFDYSLNDFTKKRILEILSTPLCNRDIAIERQHILMAIDSNFDVLADYNYPVSYLRECHEFWNNFKFYKFLKKRRSYALFIDKEDKAEHQSKVAQLILLFHRIHNCYIKPLQLSKFPESYKDDLRFLNNFLGSLQLEVNEEKLRESTFSTKNVFEFFSLLNQSRIEKKNEKFWSVLFTLEAYISIAHAKRNLNMCFPLFKDDKFKLVNFYHPILNNPIRNSVDVSSSVVVLTGANMSGKSTMLKSIGLSVYLGLLGLPIACERAVFPFFDGMFIGISHQDNLVGGYSHFLNEVRHLKMVVKDVLSGKNYLAVFDEIFSGTNAEDSLEITTKTIVGASRFEGSHFFISSHLQDLRDIQSDSNDIFEPYFIDCEVVQGKPMYTYQIKKGWSSVRVGGIIFKNEGLENMLLKKKGVGN